MGSAMASIYLCLVLYHLVNEMIIGIKVDFGFDHYHIVTQK